MNRNLISARLRADKVKIIEMYNNGVDIIELADEYDAKINTLCHRLYMWGVKVKGSDWHKKGVHKGAKPKFSPEFLAQRAINTQINNDPKKGIQYVKFGKATRRDQYLIHNIINRPVIG